MPDDTVSLRDLMEQGFEDLRDRIGLVRQDVGDLKGMWREHDTRLDTIEARQDVQGVRISWLWAVVAGVGTAGLGGIITLIVAIIRRFAGLN